MLRHPTLISLSLLCIPFAPKASAQEPGFRYERDGTGWVRVEAHGTFRVHPSVVSVRFRPTLPSFEAFRARLDELPERGGSSALAALELVRTNRLGIHDLRVGQGDDVLEVVALLRASGLVEFAEENTLGAYVSIPNDPGFSQQWPLRNTGQTGGTNDADVDGDLAWDTLVGNPSIVVGVLDSGTEVGHSDLQANTWTNAGEIQNNNLDDDGNGLADDYFGWDFYNGDENVEGPFWHGTAVTGLISARTNNGIGIAGLAGGYGATPGCRTMAVGVGDLSPDGSILDDAILYAVDEGARVITMSLTVGQSTAINSALDEAWNQANVFVDCAAGNAGGAVGYPASNPNVVSCPATDSTDNRPSWSNSGPENWVAAPGVDVYTTSTGNSYTTTSGTSFSAPHIAAGAALVFSVLPNTSNESVKEILKLGADDILQPGFDNGSGWGRLNAAASVELAASADCNQNGVWDAEDISSGSSTDTNSNGIPDDCECSSPSNYCLTAPNSNGPGALISYSGTNSVAQNDLVLHVTGGSSSQFGIFYYGPTQALLPFGEGFRCVSGTTFRLPILALDAFGDADYALDLTDPPQPAGQIDAGEVWNFQFWYRDPQGGGSNFNLSDGLEAPFCP